MIRDHTTLPLADDDIHQTGIDELSKILDGASGENPSVVERIRALADAFDYEQTLVIAQGDQAEAAAREIVELLGRGLLFLEVRAPSGVVNVSIIVGQDIPSGEG